MCYYCHTRAEKPSAPAHRTINCRTHTTTSRDILCGKCHRITPHCLHANNGYEKPWWRCMNH